MVHAPDRELVDELTKKYGTRIIPNAPIPSPPREIQSRRDFDPGSAPSLVRLEFPKAFSIANATERIQRVAELKGGLKGRVVVSSDHAAALTALVAEFAVRGRRIGLNLVGRSEQLPLSATEWPSHPAGSNPFQWGCFAGKTRIVQAWQLVESYRQLRSWPAINMTYIGILDGGFCLDGIGSPYVPPGQAGSDFGAGVLQVNLMNSSPAGGKNPSKCSDDSYCLWHGNGVASAAAATVGNGIGAAGSGGTVGRVALFKTDLSHDQVYRCLNICAAWNIPVLNMSFTVRSWEIVFSLSDWDDAFQFAANNGLIVIAAAGNDGEELPDYNVRPATRTPGVITVGALAANDSARGDSNYGSSVDIWAPGDSIPVAPDEDNPNGTFIGATSAASPIVAGVVAMLRYIDPSLNSGQVKQILTTSGWRGSGRVTVGLDAYAAAYSVMGSRLPDTAEPNDTSEQAVQLKPIGANGVLAPTYDGIVACSHRGDDDWWWFQVDSFSNANISVGIRLLQESWSMSFLTIPRIALLRT
jgi:hypothetical protein